MRQVQYFGIALCMALFAGSFAVNGNGGAYFNGVAFLVVFSGTAGAALLSFPLSRLQEALATARSIFAHEALSREGLKDELLDLSVRASCQGSACYEEIENDVAADPVLRQGVAFLADNYSLQEIQEIMGNELNAYSFERRQSEKVFRHLAGLAPAFGIAGSVIGLIGMLMGIGDTDLILQQIPVALVSTLYGIVLSSFILSPLAESIASDTNERLVQRRMVFEGLKAVHGETHPYKLARKLAAFFPAKTDQDDFVLVQEKRRAWLGLSTPQQS
jgi:chemotaxis protein MotA